MAFTHSAECVILALNASVVADCALLLHFKVKLKRSKYLPLICLGLETFNKFLGFACVFTV